MKEEFLRIIEGSTSRRLDFDMTLESCVEDSLKYYETIFELEVFFKKDLRDTKGMTLKEIYEICISD